MISKTEIQAWWDAVRLRAGWSHRIGHWKWVFLQALIPAIVVGIVVIAIGALWDGFDARTALVTGLFASGAFALLNAGRWTEDQKEDPS
ncbi:MAG: hypothetical protein AAFY82_06025 [Pseudomonadota bacterium]